MTASTPRNILPLLAAGQAQKEVTHNAALMLADILIQPAVQSAAFTNPPLFPTAGQCWLVASPASGAWTGKDGHLAAWSESGWIFIAPRPGLETTDLSNGQSVRYDGTAWSSGVIKASSVEIAGQQVLAARQAAISNPSGGETIDSQARITINSILNALRSHGLIVS